MTNEEIISKILTNYKTIREYFIYPTRIKNEADIILQIKQSGSIKGESLSEEAVEEEALRNLINVIVQLGAAAASGRPDNKTAVKVEVEDLDFPIYFVRKDTFYSIVKEIKSESEGIKLNWKIEY